MNSMIEIPSAIDIDIDKNILEIIKVRIIDLERNNLKTKAKTKNEMLEAIRNIVMEEVNKNY